MQSVEHVLQPEKHIFHPVRRPIAKIRQLIQNMGDQLMIEQLAPVEIGNDAAIRATIQEAIDKGAILGLRDAGAKVTFAQPGHRTSSEAIGAFFGVLRTALRSPSLERKASDLLDELRRDERTFVTHLAADVVLFSYPSQAFLNACAAVLAWDFDGNEVHLSNSHGWPILSLRADSATIAEGGGDRTSSPGGLAQ